MRRGARAPPAAARPGTLCGPAIPLATSGSHVWNLSLGTIVKVGNENYAVRRDLDSKLYWYPNVHVVGAKLFVKGGAGTKKSGGDYERRV